MTVGRNDGQIPNQGIKLDCRIFLNRLRVKQAIVSKRHKRLRVVTGIEGWVIFNLRSIHI